MTKKLPFILIIIPFFVFSQSGYRSLNGRIIFSSVKEMNMLEGYSENLMTTLNPGKKELNFKVQVTSFNFTNCSRAVEKMFNDVYLESHKYHWAKFDGKLADTLNMKKPGEYNINISGILNIHGVEKQRIIQGKITVKQDGIIDFYSKFKINLSDHNISILPFDTDRLSEIIEVTVNSSIQVLN